MDTYSSLQDSIVDWLNRVGSPEVAAQAPSFITLAEARFNRELRVRQMVKRATATLNDGTLTLPGDWEEAKNLQLNVGGRPYKLEVATLEQADDIRADPSYDGSRPRRYTIVGNEIEVVPTISGEAELEMTYYATLPSLADDNTSNWLLAKWPDAYLYGALVHSAPYLRDDERVAVWAAIYDRTMAEIKLADDRATHSGSSLRTRSRFRS